MANRPEMDFLNAPWQPQVVVILIAAVLLHAVFCFFLPQAKKIASGSGNVWDDALIHSASRPLWLLIWLVAATSAADIIGRHVGTPLLEYVAPIRNIGVTASMAWFLLSLASHVTDVKSMLTAPPEIDAEETLIVNFNASADSSLNLLIDTFTRTTEWVRYHEIKQDVLLKIAETIERQGLESPSRPTPYISSQIRRVHDAA